MSNPALFMYLNPEVCLSEGIYTVDAVRNYWASNNVDSNWLTEIPSDFDALSYLLNNRDDVDFSGLNATIRDLTLNMGSELRGCIIPYINEYGTCEGSNIIRFDKSNVITSNILSIGDGLSMMINDMTVYSRVLNVISDRELMLDSNVTIPRTTRVKVVGTRIYDLERLARVNYVKASGDLRNRVLDSNFNADLYRMLYMDTRDLISDVDAYKDYASYNGTRIGSVLDFGSLVGTGGGNADPISDGNAYEFTVTNNLTLGNELIWQGLRVEYVTNDPLRRLGILSEFECGFATEYAMKQWVTNLFWPNSILSNVSLSNLQVKSVQGAETFFENDVTFIKPVKMTSNLYVDDTIFAERANFNSSLYVKGNTQLDGELYSCNITTKEFIYTPVIGIGPTNYSEYPFPLIVGNTNNTFPQTPIFSSGSNGGVIIQITDVKTDNLTLNNLVIREAISLTHDINTLGNITSTDLILPMSQSNIFDMLYETNSLLKLPQDNITERVLDIKSSLEEPTSCSTNGVNLIYYDNTPDEANFVYLANETVLKIINTTNTYIEVLSSSLPDTVEITAFKLVNQSAISVATCLYELTKQMNTLTNKLFTNCHFLSIMHCGQ